MTTTAQTATRPTKRWIVVGLGVGAIALLIGALLRRAQPTDLEAVARGVALPTGLKNVGTFGSSRGCSGGCTFLTEDLCTTAAPEQTLVSLRSAWERSGASFDDAAHRYKADGHGDGYTIEIDADPAGRLEPSSSAVSDRSCPDPADHLLILYLTATSP